MKSVEIIFNRNAILLIQQAIQYVIFVRVYKFQLIQLNYNKLKGGHNAEIEKNGVESLLLTIE